MINRTSLLAAVVMLIWVSVPMTLYGFPDNARKAAAAFEKFKKKQNSGWAYNPVQNSPLPLVHQSDWPTTTVDYFVLEAIEKAGLQPSVSVNKEQFIRRVTLDTWGLVPTPEEVEAFKRDQSPRPMSV
nr:DUF1549 domain-containing protein [Catenovulum sediminis]